MSYAKDYRNSSLFGNTVLTDIIDYVLDMPKGEGMGLEFDSEAELDSMRKKIYVMLGKLGRKGDFSVNKNSEVTLEVTHKALPTIKKSRRTITNG